MSQLERLREEKLARNGKKPVNSQTGGTGRLLSFNPNEPQKMAVKSMYSGTDELVYGLGRCLARGLKVSLGYTEKSDSFYAIAREVNADWTKADGVSGVHRDLVRALGTLLYALEEVYPEWPRKGLPAQLSDIDWD